MQKDLSRKDLYESVKTLVETENKKFLHLNQHKLYSLFSIAFQYILFKSTKAPGVYIIRVENSGLAEKLAKKSKDPSTRKFIQSLLLPRKLKYGKSTFLLDFFHAGSWNMTNEIPSEKIKGAIVIKSASKQVMNGTTETEDAEGNPEDGPKLPENYYIESLREVCPALIAIAHEEEYKDFTTISFPFIKKDKEKIISGVTLNADIDWDNID